MPTHSTTHIAATGKTVYAYPTGQSLADWTTYRVSLAEGTGDNIGRYTGTLDDANGYEWLVFEQALQPASWDLAVALITIAGLIQGTIQTLDALDTAQDAQHATTQGKVDTAQAALDTITGTGVTATNMRGTDDAMLAASYTAPDNAGISTAAVAAASAASSAGTAATNTSTILNRLGSWTGSARNTVLGAFQALFRKDADATVPSDVNADLGSGAGAADNTTDSLEGLADNAGGGSLTQQQVADALKLAPTSGTPASGSVYGDLDTLGDRTGDGVIIRVPAPSAATGETLTLVKGDDYSANTSQIIIDVLLSTLGYGASDVGSVVLEVQDEQSEIEMFTTEAGTAVETTNGDGQSVMRFTFNATSSNTDEMRRGQNTAVGYVRVTIGSETSTPAIIDIDVT